MGIRPGQLGSDDTCQDWRSAAGVDIRMKGYVCGGIKILIYEEILS